MKVKTKAFAITTLILLQLLAYSSCEDEGPDLQVEFFYALCTGCPAQGPPITLVFSTDNGTTFSERNPVFKKGAKILVKVTEGTQDLDDTDYVFDWSGSSPAPISFESGIATFKGEEGMTIGALISPK